MLPAHVLTLVQARSCLAALADGTPALEASSGYDHVLIVLDSVHGDNVPALETDDLPPDRSALFELAYGAIEELVSHGVDELQVELLLAMLGNARDRELG